MRRILLALLAIVLAGGVAVAVAGYMVVFAPNTKLYDEKRSVYVPRQSSFEAVIDSLESADILQSATTLRLLGRATGWGGQVKAGHYAIASGASNYEMLDIIRKGLQEPVRLTIPPGTRPETVAAVSQNFMAFTAEELMAAFTDSSLAESLDVRPSQVFSYMLPETYHFYWLTDAGRVVTEIKKQFDAFYDAELRAHADSLGLSKEEVVTLASIVEWETSIEEEKPRVAGVYLNRLRIGMALQADPTIQYILMVEEGQKRRVLYDDLRIESPYNTYLHPGLPPGPINNPAPSTLRAVVNPEPHDYLYFVADGNGSHIFSRTHAEHTRAAARYHELMRERRRELREQEAAGNSR